MILFVCEGNMMRSQMAEVFYNSINKNHKAQSAGAVAETDSHISERASKVMSELGYDTSKLHPKQVTKEMINSFDRIIYFPSSYMPEWIKESDKSEFWDVVDPHYHKEQGMQLVREVRDEIKERVRMMT